MTRSPTWLQASPPTTPQPWLVSRFLAKLAGGQPSVLAQSPGDLIRYVAMGGVLLTTAAVAGISATFALNTALNLDLPSSIVAGVLWAVMILNLDRMLVVSMRHRGSRTLLTAAPRVVLAVLIGFVISTPIVLQVFRPEIEGEIQAIHAEDLTANQQKLDQEFADIQPLSDQVNQLQQTASGSSVKNVSDDPDVKAAKATLAGDTDAYNAAQHDATCEFDGTCGTGVPGNGAQYREKQAFADSLKTKVDADRQAVASAEQAASTRLNNSNQSLQRDAQAQLALLQPRLTARENARTAAQAQLTDAETKNTGLLIRLEALERLSADRPLLAVAHWSLFALFLAIEILPVLVKLLSMAGPKPLYDTLVERREGDAERNDAQWSAQQQTITDIRLQVRVKLEQDRAKAQVRRGKAINGLLVKEQAKLAKKALDAWAKVAAARTDDEVARWAQQYAQSRQAVISPQAGVAPSVTALPQAATPSMPTGPTPTGTPTSPTAPTGPTPTGPPTSPTAPPSTGPTSAGPTLFPPTAPFPRPTPPPPNGAPLHAAPSAANGAYSPARPAAAPTHPLTSRPDFSAFEKTILGGLPTTPPSLSATGSGPAQGDRGRHNDGTDHTTVASAQQ